MNILHFAHSYIPQYGGTTTRLINLLADPQHRHTLVVPMSESTTGNPLPTEEQIGNVNLHRVPLRGGPSIGPFAARNAKLLTAVVRADERFDIVHCHNPPTFARAGFRIARLRNLRCIYEAHRLSFDSYGANRDSQLPQFADRFIRWGIRREERPFFERADAVIVQTTMHRDRVCELFRIDANRIYVIPMCVDEQFFDPAAVGEAGAALRDRHGWHDRTVFFYNGYLGTSNGIQTLLDATRALSPEIRRRIRIAILGRGPLQNLVERAVRAEPDLVQFLGLIPYEQMPAYYAAADVVAIPLEPVLMMQCNNSTKLLEAMAMERPILASDVGGVTELLDNGVTGVTFRSGVVADLSKKMADMTGSQSDLDALGRAARRRVIRDRTWQQAQDALDRLYRSVR